MQTDHTDRENDFTPALEQRLAYQAIVDHSLQGLIVIQDMRVVFANGAMAKISGYRADEMLALPPASLRNFVHPLDRERIWQQHEARLQGASLPEQQEFRVIRKDGSVRWLQIHTSRVEYQGRPAIQAACVDTTERRRTEEALRRSQARNLALLNANPDLMFRISAGGVFLDCKPPKDDAVLSSPAQFVGKHLEEVFPPAVTRLLMQHVRAALEAGQVQTLEYRLPGPAGGEDSDFECRLVACAEQEVVAIVRDISERRRAERLARLQRDVAIRLSSLSGLTEGLQYCLEAAIQAAQMDCGGIYTIDEGSDCLRLAVHQGLSKDFVDSELTYPRHSRSARMVRKGEAVYTLYGALGIPLGPHQRAERLRAVGIIPIAHDGRIVACLNVASHTIDEVPPWSRVVLETIGAEIGSVVSRLRIQEALQQAEQEKAIILNTMPQIVAYHDTSHRILWANRTAVEALGRPVEEIVGRACHELWEGTSTPCDDCPVDRALRTGSAQEKELVGYNGGFWLVRGEPVRDAAGAVIGVVEMALDISRRRRDEEELRRRLQFEETIAGISADFTHLHAGEIEAGLGRTLAAVGRLLQADRGYIYLVHEGGMRMSRVHAWFADGNDTPDDWLLDADPHACSWALEQLAHAGVLSLPRIADLAGPAAEIKGVLESISVKSLLAVPIMIGGQFFGFLGLSAVREERAWPEDAASLLKTVAEILANALERRRTADAMNERLAFERLLSDLSATFINLAVDAIDGEIEQSLARIGAFLGLDRSTVLQFSGSQACVTHSWAAPGLERALHGAYQEGTSWSIDQLRQGRILAYPQVDQMPAEARQEQAHCQREGIKSLLVMPVEAANSMLGAVAFSSVRVQREWPEELVQRLRLVAQIFANALLRRRAEAALQASEEQFRSLFQNAVLGIYRTTPDGRILMANPSLIRMLGYASFEEFAARNREGQGFPPTCSWAAFREMIESQGQVVGLESTWTRRDGTPVFVRENARAIRGREGNVVCYEGTVEDITERKRAEAALRESEQNYREIFNATNDALLIHDPVTGAIVDVNRTTLETYGYTREELLQLTLGGTDERESPYSRQEVLARIHRAAEGEPQLFEWLSRKKNGAPIWEEVSLRNATIGGRPRVLAVVRDITDRKRIEDQMRQHLAELTRAWHANLLGEMASGLAHELNQPLCAIVNYSNGCLRLTRKKGYSLDVLQNSIECIATQAQRAADIIKRIRGLIARREPQWTELDLDGILVDAAQMLRNEILEHNVTLVSRCQPDLPKIKGDNVEIAQVVLNLMKNALEAMSDPEIVRRSLTISTHLSHNQQVEVAVEDTGRGVSPELSERIFESFFTTKPQGLGIGLSLSRRIIEAHGGRLWVESGPGSGAAFRFTLPVEGGVYG